MLAAALAVFTAFVALVPDDAVAGQNSSQSISRQPKKSEPLTIVISLSQQRLKVYDSKGVIAQSPISSGTRGRETPTGIFSVLQKNRMHFSNLYDDAPMPNMQRITWSGVALHAGHLPGYPASHGCIRLPYSFSRSLFSMTEVGTRVIVHKDMIEPEPFEHAKLFVALPPGEAEVPTPIRRNEAVAGHSKAAGLGTVSAMLGVSPAAAAEAALEVAAQPRRDSAIAPGAVAPKPSSQERTRAMALAERNAEADAKARVISERETLSREASDALEDVNGRLNQAQNDLKDSKRQEADLKRDVVAKQRAEDASERKLKAFIEQQIKEKPRLDARAQARLQEHMADAASALDTEELLKRSDARNSEVQRDAAEREDAAQKENAFEAEYLQSIHDREAAEAAVSAQVSVIEARAEAVKGLQAEVLDARKALNKSREALEQAREELKRVVGAIRLFAKPASIFISRKTGQLKIRQGHEEVFSTPVTFQMPEATIGTHVFSALGYADASETKLKWRAVTFSDASAERRDRRGRDDKKIVEGQIQGAPAATPGNALDRLEIPAEALAKINELIKPGSTLIISDANASPETGTNTDFIVQPRI